MPLVSFRSELDRARRGSYAVPCFIAFDSMSAEGIVSALERRRAPGILGIHTRIVARAAHAVGASVEAELGHVGSGSEHESFGRIQGGVPALPRRLRRFGEGVNRSDAMRTACPLREA
jgi:fructose/tagatose bisphosphate aldolase